MATDEQIAEAFNGGYTMQKFEPAMMEKLLSTKNDSEIMQAMAQGAKQGYLTYFDKSICPDTSYMVHEYRDRKELVQIDDKGATNPIKIL